MVAQGSTAQLQSRGATKLNATVPAGAMQGGNAYVHKAYKIPHKGLTVNSDPRVMKADV